MDYKKFELVPETEKYINILNEEGNEELLEYFSETDYWLCKTSELVSKNDSSNNQVEKLYAIWILKL